jgi:hypothetical protein
MAVFSILVRSDVLSEPEPFVLSTMTAMSRAAHRQLNATVTTVINRRERAVRVLFTGLSRFWYSSSIPQALQDYKRNARVRRFRSSGTAMDTSDLAGNVGECGWLLCRFSAGVSQPRRYSVDRGGQRIVELCRIFAVPLAAEKLHLNQAERIDIWIP